VDVDHEANSNEGGGMNSTKKGLKETTADPHTTATNPAEVNFQLRGRRPLAERERRRIAYPPPPTNGFVVTPLTICASNNSKTRQLAQKNPAFAGSS